MLTRLFKMESSIRGSINPVARTAIEAALTLTTGILLARFAWLALAPGDVPAIDRVTVGHQAAAPEQRFAILTSTDPVSGAAIAVSRGPAVPTSLNLKLAGLRWAGDTKSSGSAIVTLPDGSQKRIAPGEQIVDGAVLDTVAADRIFLRFNGELQELLLKDRGGQIMATAPPAAAIASAAGSPAEPATQRVTPALLAADIALQPETRGGIVTGYQLSPRGAGHFEAAGLQPGDFVIRVNGESVEGMAPASLQAAVLSSDSIGLDVVRAGAIVRLRISPDSGLAQ